MCCGRAAYPHYLQVNLFSGNILSRCWLYCGRPVYPHYYKCTCPYKIFYLGAGCAVVGLLILTITSVLVLKKYFYLGAGCAVVGLLILTITSVLVLKGLLVFIPKYYMIIVPMCTLMKSI